MTYTSAEMNSEPKKCETCGIPGWTKGINKSKTDEENME